MMIRVGLSGCFAGFNCRFDGYGFKDFDLESLRTALKAKLQVNEIEFFPVCPEQLGGMTTPREPSEILNADGLDVIEGRSTVISKSGIDVTESFLRGANETLNFAKKFNIKCFVLKQRSPSCGSKEIYTGKFDGSKRPGGGVTTALLEQNGIKVYSEELISKKAIN